MPSLRRRNTAFAFGTPRTVLAVPPTALDAVAGCQNGILMSSRCSHPGQKGSQEPSDSRRYTRADQAEQRDQRFLHEIGRPAQGHHLFSIRPMVATARLGEYGFVSHPTGFAFSARLRISLSSP